MQDIFKATIKSPEKTAYEGEDNDEKILYVVRESVWSVIPSLFSVAIFVIIPIFLFPYLFSVNQSLGLGLKPAFISTLNIFWYILTLGYFFQIFTNWYFNIFIVTTKKIIDFDVHGISYKNVSETSLRNVEDVTSRVSGTLGTIFNIGDVFVQTAAEQKEFEFRMVDNPGQIRDIVSDLISNLKRGGENN